MPAANLKPCSYPGCPKLTKEKYCEEHKKEKNKQESTYRGSSNARGYNSRWRRESQIFLKARAYLCAECQGTATEVDHIIPHKGDQEIFWDPSNWQPLCKTCHNRKTMIEGALGYEKRYPSKSLTTKNAIVVNGAPGSGKTTYVTKHMKRGDIVIDYDIIQSALNGLPIYDKPNTLQKFMWHVRNSILDITKLHINEIRTLWIITTHDAEELQIEFNAKLIAIDPGYNECIRRLYNDKRRENAEQIQVFIKKWYNQYAKV